MKNTFKCIVPLLLFCLFETVSFAQCKLIIEYDVAGNRISRGMSGDGKDLAPSFTLLPTIAHGVTDMGFHIQIQEVDGGCGSGTTTVIIPKDARLSFTYDSNLTSMGPWSLDNSSWTYDGTNGSFHIWTTDESIDNNSSLSFGFNAQYDPQNTTGINSISVTILTGSGGETDGSNNSDAETLIFHSN